MRINYIGHSCVQIDNCVIDPFITDNPMSKISLDDLHGVELVCVTHDHYDHVADAVVIAQKYGVPIICIVELAKKLGENGVETIGINIGGSVMQAGWRVTMTPAWHSAEIGEPAGLILTHEATGKKIYHAGDTALFSDMQLIGKKGIDVAFIPIGDRFTMGIDDAITAIDLIALQQVIPIHYNTWPIITADPQQLVEQSAKPVRVMQPGETIDL